MVTKFLFFLYSLKKVEYRKTYFYNQNNRNHNLKKTHGSLRQQNNILILLISLILYDLSYILKCSPEDRETPPSGALRRRIFTDPYMHAHLETR